jgi:hypothetical protein
MRKSLVKINPYSISVHKQSEEFIESIQKLFLNQGDLDIKLPLYFDSEYFTTLGDNLTGIGGPWNFNLLDSNSSLVNSIDYDSNDYSFLAYNREKVLYFDKRQERIKLFNKAFGRETDSIDFKKPDGATLKGWFISDNILVSAEKFPYVNIYCYDKHLNKKILIEEYNFYLSNVYCINNQLNIVELSHNGNLKLCYRDKNFKKLFQRNLMNLYISSYRSDGILFLNQNWSEYRVYSYDGYADHLNLIKIPNDLIIKQFERIRFRNKGRYAFCLTADKVLERYNVVKSSHRNYYLANKISLGNLTDFEGYSKNDEHIFYRDQNNIILKKSDSLKTVFITPKNEHIFSSISLRSDSMIIKKSGGNFNEIELVNLLNYNHFQIKLPNRQKFRTFYALEDSLYFGFDEDNMGIGKFNFNTGSYDNFQNVSKIRNFVDSGHDSLLAAGWFGLYEFSKDLTLIRQFPVPGFVERGYEVYTYDNNKNGVVIYAGYAKEAKLGDNFILIYDYKTQKKVFEFIDKAASNGYSYPVKVTKSGILYYPAFIEGKQYLVALNLDTLENTDFKLPMNFDFREMHIYENFLFGVSLKVKDGNSIIDVVHLNTGKRCQQISITCPTEIIDISLAQDRLIVSFNNSSYWVYRLCGSNLVFDFEIKSRASWFYNSIIKIFPDILLLNEYQNLIFFNHKTKQTVCKLNIYGDSIFLITNDKWLYSNNDNLLSVSRENKEGLKEFLPVSSEDRKRYFSTFNSLSKVIEALNPQFYFEKMKTEYLKNINEVNLKSNKMLK